MTVHDTTTDTLMRVGKALADPTRCRIVQAVLAGNHYPSDIAEQLGISRTNVSNHLRCLRGCGIVTTIAQGRRLEYTIASDELAAALTRLTTIELHTDPDEDCVIGCCAPTQEKSTTR